MKIFYAVQATGNGHISRAMEILPYLQEYGEVDICLSGSNSDLNINTDVKFRNKGLSLFCTGKGGLHYGKIAKALNPIRLYNEVKQLPVDKYDLVINDFDMVTSIACAIKKVKSVNFGHQASFMSTNTPRPAKRDIIGEFVLKNYARASSYVGLHFENYDNFILPPVIKKEIWYAQPKNKGHFTVYLQAYSDAMIATYLLPLKQYQFHVFSKEVKRKTIVNNICFMPVDKHMFNASLINCEGIIAGAGFETPAEALYLQKKILVMPTKGQYEQQCNAAALELLGVKTFTALDNDFASIFDNWLNYSMQPLVQYNKNTEMIIANMMSMAAKAEEIPVFSLKNLAWE